MKNLCIVSNECSTFINGKVCFQNKIIETILAGLQDKYNVIYCAPYKGNININHCVQTMSLLFSWRNTISNFIKLYKCRPDKVLIFSISPFTVFMKLYFLIFWKVKTILYLQSDRKKEYIIKLGLLGGFLYNLLRLAFIYNSIFITASNENSRNKKLLIKPSIIDDKWVINRYQHVFGDEHIKLLYVGRLKVEKGIYSLIKLLNESQMSLKLSIIGEGNSLIENKNVLSVGYINDEIQLISYYDEHHIIVVPSYTESYCKVIDESLSRLRPVIVFREVSQLALNRFGIFVCERTVNSFDETILYIINEYDSIIESMRRNVFQTKDLYLTDLTTIIG
jgi:glycosyltransferase involved in cell wall biosynthesis